MSETRRPRRIWTWPERAAYWVYGFFLGPFLTKLPDGTVQGAMTRWAVAFFTAAEVHRLWQMPLGTATLAEAFIIFCILFALPIDGALSRAKPAEVLELLGKPFTRAGEAVDAGASMTTTLTQEVAPAPAPAPAPTPDADSLPPANDGAAG